MSGILKPDSRRLTRWKAAWMSEKSPASRRLAKAPAHAAIGASFWR
jgi:hypothetical protein